MCPHCEKPLFGSASKGRLGKYYPAYHCNKRGHYFRVPKADFEKTITKFVKGLSISQEYIDELVSVVTEEWNKRQLEDIKDKVNIDSKISALKTQSQMTIEKIKLLNSEVAIKYMEEELVKIELEIADFQAEKEKVAQIETPKADLVMAYIKYFLEHMDYLLLEQPNPVNKAGSFGVIFDKAPTYQEIDSGTRELAQFVALNDVFVRSKNHLAAGQGFEPQ